MSRRSTPASRVLNLLTEDHAKLRKLFVKFHSATLEARAAIALQAIHGFQFHGDLEERLIYPALQAAIGADVAVMRAREEHRKIHQSIRKLMRLRPSDEACRIAVRALAEQIQDHIEQEERHIFTRAKASRLDWQTLEMRVMARIRIIEAHRSREAKRNMETTHKVGCNNGVCA